MQIKEALAVLPQSELCQIRTDLQFIKDNLSKKGEESFSEKYIESKRVPSLLKISNRTWQTYRDKGEIPFIQFGSKIWVKRSDLDKFLEKFYIIKK